MLDTIRVSEAFLIAVHSMLYLAMNKDRVVSGKEIATKLGASESHLLKVHRSLVKAGFISSATGPTGGFKIKVDANDLKLIDLYEVLEGKYFLGDCPFKGALCKTICSLRNEIEIINNHYLKYLKETSLGDNLKSINQD